MQDDLARKAVDDLELDGSEWDNAFEEQYGADQLKAIDDKDDKDDDGADDKGDDKGAGDGDDVQKTDEEKAAEAEEAKKAEEDAAAQKAAEEAEAEKAKGETPEQTEARHKQEADDTKAAEDAKAAEEAAKAKEPTDVQRTVQETLKAERDAKTFEAAVKNDIREGLFADVQTELQDKDGNPIKTIEDVMQLENPSTGTNFTEEEAGLILLKAQQNLNRSLADMDKQIETIAQTHLDLKDEADRVETKYGRLLRALPEVADQVWAAYEKTLIKDEKSGIITKAPLSLAEFYDTALAGQVKLVEVFQQKVANEAKAEQEAAAKKEADEAAAKKEADKKARDERGDIKGIIDNDDDDDADDGWGKALKNYYKG